MTDKELLQMALNTLDLVTDLTNYDDEVYETIEAIKARLAQPDCVCGEPDSKGVHRKDKPCYMQPKKEWVGLTDDERDEIYNRHSAWVPAVEAKLKEKNT